MKYRKVKRPAESREMVEIIKTGEIKEVRFTFGDAGIHINDFYLTSYLKDEYLVLEPLGDEKCEDI